MRRNCPYCSADQVVADEKLTAGWIFLKCHHCAETSVLQGKASLRLMQFSSGFSGRPVRKPLDKSDEPSVDFIKPVLSLPPVPEFLKAERAEKQLTQAELATIKTEPLLVELESSSSQNSQPIPILLEEEKAPRSFHQAAVEWARDVVKGDFSHTLRPYALPFALAVVCFGSGGYLLRSAKQIREGAWLLPIQNPVSVASDIAPSDMPPTTAPKTVAASPVNVSAPVAAPAPLAVTQQAMSRAPASQRTEEKVEVLTANAVLRAGPGLHYNKVGTARAELQLLVKGSFDNWLEVRTGGGSKTAWIRSDLVKPIVQPTSGPIQKVARQEAQP